MKPFEYFIQLKEVNKISPDIELAKSLLSEVETRIEIALEMKLDERKARIIFELLYDSLRELTDVILALDGFKSYSHEANLSYLSKFKEFETIELMELNRFRKIRNSSKYYGKPAKLEDALEIKKTFPEMREKLMKIINNKLKNKK